MLAYNLDVFNITLCTFDVKVDILLLSTGFGHDAYLSAACLQYLHVLGLEYTVTYIVQYMTLFKCRVSRVLTCPWFRIYCELYCAVHDVI